MALDRQDLQDFDSLVEENPNLNTQELRAIMLKGIERNELKMTLRNYGGIIYSRFEQVIQNFIEDIEALETDEERLDFIIKKSYALHIEYVEDQKRREAEQKELIEKMQNDSQFLK